MINLRISARLLKRAGIALVVMPEAVTTPIGIALILTSRYISKKLEADLYKRVGETVKQYLAHSKRHTENADGKSDEKEPAKRAAHNTDRIIPNPAESKPVARKIKAKETAKSGDRLMPVARNSEPAPAAIQSQRQPEVKPIHHTVDTKWLARRYAMAGVPTPAPDEAEKSTLHAIDRQKIARRFNIESNPSNMSSADKPAKAIHHPAKKRAPPEKPETEEAEPLANHHKIDAASLRRRYGAAALR